MDTGLPSHDVAGVRNGDLAGLKKGSYINYFTFFTIVDAFLRQIQLTAIQITFEKFVAISSFATVCLGKNIENLYK